MTLYVNEMYSVENLLNVDNILPTMQAFLQMAKSLQKPGLLYCEAMSHWAHLGAQLDEPFRNTDHPLRKIWIQMWQYYEKLKTRDRQKDTKWLRLQEVLCPITSLILESQQPTIYADYLSLLESELVQALEEQQLPSLESLSQSQPSPPAEVADPEVIKKSKSESFYGWADKLVKHPQQPQQHASEGPTPKEQATKMINDFKEARKHWNVELSWKKAWGEYQAAHPDSLLLPIARKAFALRAGTASLELLFSVLTQILDHRPNLDLSQLTAEVRVYLHRKQPSICLLPDGTLLHNTQPSYSKVDAEGFSAPENEE